MAAAETCYPDPRHRPGVSCDRLTYLCKLTQCILQHFHSEDEGALCQDLAVSISQIFPAVRGTEIVGQSQKPYSTAK